MRNEIAQIPNYFEHRFNIKGQGEKIMQGFFVWKTKRVFLIGFVLIFLTASISAQNMFRKMNDFDGDGKADFAIVRNEGDFQVGIYKVWYIWQSRDGFRAFRWGINGDMHAAGDYDGDGKTDIAVLRATNLPPFIHYFWIWNSGSNNFTQVGFEVASPVLAPVHQDYNGDGKVDPAIWVGSIIEPPGSTITHVSARYSGTAGGGTQYQISPRSAPSRVGDLTGDGRADGIHRDSLSSNPGVKITDIATGITSTVQFGITGDRFVSGDFDGDGIGELAIWRSSNGSWWWIRSSDSIVQVANWGISGDIPVPADYDGDGKTDVAIWRSGSDQAYYWVYGSQSGISVVAWGLSTDKVVEP